MSGKLWIALLVAAGASFFVLRGEDDAGGRIQTISHGERVEIEDYVQDEGLTLIEFTADW